jgi:hypothetical protein
VFKLTPPAQGQTHWSETVLHTFTGGLLGGFDPQGGLVAFDGALFGTSPVGGALVQGTTHGFVYKVAN